MIKLNKLQNSLSKNESNYFKRNKIAEEFHINQNKNYFNNNKLDSFHRAIGPVMFVAQFFSIMPVTGLLSADPSNIKFKIISIQFIGTIVFIVCALLFIYAIVERIFFNGINARNAVNIIFYGCGISACLLFLKLAIKWPKIIQFWSDTEIIFLRHPYKSLKWKLSTRIRITSLIILCLSLIEHGMSVISATYSFYQYSVICEKSNFNFGKFMIATFPHFFLHLTYNIGVSIFILILNGVFTLIWNYLDLFIALISFGITIRFTQLNSRIIKFSREGWNKGNWSEIREHYVKLCDLVDLIDENLSPIVLLSFLNNLYFICNQLLNIFNKLRWSINYMYFWYSVLYLIGRTVFVNMIAANINVESKIALKELRKVPTLNRCVEIQRLTNQMSTQSVALSGMGFFFLTRNLLFGMASTIITYELVLLQFDESPRNERLPPLCS